MNKVCCVGDSDICPNSPSCPMILRSACSHHRHSRESSVTSEKSSTKLHRKSKHKTNEVSSNESPSFGSSLKLFALNSIKSTYSLIENRNSKASQNVNQRFDLANSVLCTTESNFSHLPASGNTGLNDSGNRRDCAHVYQNLVESDSSSDLFECTSSMAITRFPRSSVSTRYDSEGEDDITVNKVIRKKTDVNSNYSVRSRTVSGQMGDGSQNSQNSSSVSENNYLTDMSSVQSSFHRFRWFIWSFIYLRIIQMCNCDVWLLSKVHSIGKLKSVCLILLPLITYILWLTSKAFLPNMLHDPLFEEEPSSFVPKESVYLSALGTFLNIWELPSFLQNVSWFYPTAVFSYFAGWFSVNKKSSSSSSSNNEHFLKESVHQSGAAEFREMLIMEKKISMLKQTLMDEMSSLKKLQQSESAKVQNFEMERKILQQSIQNFKSEFQLLSEKIEKMEKDRRNQDKEKSLSAEHLTTLSSDYKNLNFKLKEMEEKLGILESLKNCCDKFTVKDLAVFFEKNIASVFKNIIDGDSDPKSELYFFNQWLASKFFTQDRLMKVIKAAMKKQSSSQQADVDHDFVVRAVESTVQKYVQEIKKNLTDLGTSGSYRLDVDVFSDDKVKKIVKEAIMLYDADKTGRVDYALESAGGSVLGTRCTETYVEKYGLYSFLGIPVWSASNSPRTAIQPDMQPGRCWAFKGSQGFLVIELSAKIFPTGFTMEHIPVSLSPTGSIDSAPKKFSVWGLESEKDIKGSSLGEFYYDISGEPLQYFRIKEPSEKSYKFIQLQIESNNGNIDYTCLYRFRVHGVRSR